VGAELVIFLKRDHGALLQITGRPRKALQYEIGNAITATRMTRHQIPATPLTPLVEFRPFEPWCERGRASMF
jgi:hypothetical protein